MGTIMQPPDLSNKWRVDGLEANNSSKSKVMTLVEYDCDWQVTGNTITVRANTMGGLAAIADKLGAVDA